MFWALDTGILAGVAHDAAGITSGDVKDPFYQRLCAHPKILATPHIASKTPATAKTSNDMMITNIEAWLAGKPINIVE